MPETIEIRINDVNPAGLNGPPRPAGGAGAAASSGFDPAAIARQQMDRERQARQVDLARQQIDPAYRQRQQEQAAADIERANARDDLDREYARRRQEQEKLAEEKRQLELNMLDPVFRARQAMEAAFKRDSIAQEDEAARRQIDTVYRLRREKEEALADEKAALEKARLDPVFRVREKMEQEAADKREREEMDRIRRRIDPVYAAKRKEEESQAAGQRRSEGYRAGTGVINAVGAAAGQSAGAIGALGGGPGSAVQSMTGMVSAIGAIAGVAGPVGIFTAAIGAAAAAVVSFADGVGKTADRLAPYSAPLSVAQANAEVTQILRDIERADKLGNDLSAFIAAKSELSQTWQDLMAMNVKAMLPFITEGVKQLTAFIQYMMRDFPLMLAENIVDPLLKANNEIKNFLMRRSDKFESILPAVKMWLDKMNSTEDGGDNFDVLIKSLLQMQAPGAQVTGAGRIIDPRLNMPAFGG